jgi:hypothetical protein
MAEAHAPRRLPLAVWRGSDQKHQDTFPDGAAGHHSVMAMI